MDLLLIFQESMNSSQTHLWFCWFVVVLCVYLLRSLLFDLNSSQLFPWTSFRNTIFLYSAFFFSRFLSSFLLQLPPTVLLSSWYFFNETISHSFSRILPFLCLVDCSVSQRLTKDIFSTVPAAASEIIPNYCIISMMITDFFSQMMLGFAEKMSFRWTDIRLFTQKEREKYVWQSHRDMHTDYSEFCLISMHCFPPQCTALLHVPTSH